MLVMFSVRQSEKFVSIAAFLARAMPKTVRSAQTAGARSAALSTSPAGTRTGRLAGRATGSGIQAPPAADSI